LYAACKRIADDYPAGVVELRGEYVASHREELERLARNIEERERAEHPLKRIASIKANGDVLEIATTDPKLARGIGTALRRAHRGTLHAPPTSRENLVRITWSAERERRQGASQLRISVARRHRRPAEFKLCAPQAFAGSGSPCTT
jgi:hypothetical protein